jgi:3-methyl-2-oxobutanoate hydroxymethyltransferase
VYHDLLGIEQRMRPRFVRRYAELGSVSVEALMAFAGDVRAGRFPADDETYHLSAEVAETLNLYGAKAATGE